MTLLPLIEADIGSFSDETSNTETQPLNPIHPTNPFKLQSVQINQSNYIRHSRLLSSDFNQIKALSLDTLFEEPIQENQSIESYKNIVLDLQIKLDWALVELKSSGYGQEKPQNQDNLQDSSYLQEKTEKQDTLEDLRKIYSLLSFHKQRVERLQKQLEQHLIESKIQMDSLIHELKDQKRFTKMLMERTSSCDEVVCDRIEYLEETLKNTHFELLKSSRAQIQLHKLCENERRERIKAQCIGEVLSGGKLFSNSTVSAIELFKEENYLDVLENQVDLNEYLSIFPNVTYDDDDNNDSEE